MDTNKMREEFETSPKFSGMDFSRSSTHPDYYESPYANGAWYGWQASREAVVVELPRFEDYPASMERDMRESLRSAIEAQGLKVAP